MKILIFVVALLPSYASALILPSEPGLRGVKLASEEEQTIVNQDSFTRSLKGGPQGTTVGSKPNNKSEAVSEYESSLSRKTNSNGQATEFGKVGRNGNNRSRMSIKGMAMSRKQDRKTVKGMKSSFGPSRTNQPSRKPNPKSREGEKRGVLTGTQENNKEITTPLKEKSNESNQGHSNYPNMASQQGRPNYPTREGSSKLRTEKYNNNNESQNRAQTPVAPPTSFRANKPTSPDTYPPTVTKRPTISPSTDPNLMTTNAPTAGDTLVQTPEDTVKSLDGSVDTSFDQPTTSPTSSPSGRLPSDAPSGAPVDFPSASPSSTPTSNFLQACRCDELNKCLFQALPTNTSLKICIFVEEEGSELVNIESLFFFQGDLEQIVLKPGDASLTEKQKTCRDNVCAVETMVSSGFFNGEGSAVLTAEGQAIVLAQTDEDDLNHAHRSLRSVHRRVQQIGDDARNVVEVRFAAIVELGTSSVAVGGGESRPEVAGEKGTDNSLPIIAWLIPLLIIALILGIGLGHCLRRRRQIRQH